MTLIDENSVPEKERDDLAQINSELELVAALRVDIIDPLDDPYCKSKIGWNAAVFSNAMVHRFVSLAEGVGLSWNSSHILSAVLNARAMSETAAIYWEFSRQFSRVSKILDLEAINKLTMSYLFGTRDEGLLKDAPELKARQVLNAIDLVDKTLITGFRSYYDRLSEFCHPNSMGHRGLFSTLDKDTGITAFGIRASADFLLPVKCALGTTMLVRQAHDRLSKDIEAFALAHHVAHPSPLAKK
jgi:hypothetical protein